MRRRRCRPRARSPDPARSSARRSRSRWPGSSARPDPRRAALYAGNPWRPARRRSLASGAVDYRIEPRADLAACDAAVGLELVTWTMDPLQSRNARFNLAKLGAYASEYHDDFYGEMPDKLNAGMPSDRFVIEWPIATDRVNHRLRGEDPIASLADAEREVPYLLRAEGDRPGGEGRLDGSHLLVATPWDIDAIKRKDIGLAREWRLAQRRTLGAALTSGYAAVEYLVADERGAYLLIKRPPIVEARRREEE